MVLSLVPHDCCQSPSSHLPGKQQVLTIDSDSTQSLYQTDFLAETDPFELQVTPKKRLKPDDFVLAAGRNVALGSRLLNRVQF